MKRARKNTYPELGLGVIELTDIRTQRQYGYKPVFCEIEDCRKLIPVVRSHHTGKWISRHNHSTKRACCLSHKNKLVRITGAARYTKSRAGGSVDRERNSLLAASGIDTSHLDPWLQKVRTHTRHLPKGVTCYSEESYQQLCN